MRQRLLLGVPSTTSDPSLYGKGAERVSPCRTAQFPSSRVTQYWKPVTGKSSTGSGDVRFARVGLASMVSKKLGSILRSTFNDKQEPR